MMTQDMPVSETETLDLTIPAWRLGLLEERIASIARKANKYGVPAPEYTVTREYEKTETIFTDTGQTYTKVTPMVEIELTCITVRVQGDYKFVARIDHEYVDGKVRNFVMGGADDDTRLLPYREAKGNCDHCGHNRQRKTTYIIHDRDADMYMQIGSTCLKAFFGINPAHAVASLQWIDELSRVSSDEYSGGTSYCPLTAFVNHACAVIGAYGYTKASDCDGYNGKVPTANLISTNVYPGAYTSKDDVVALTPESKANAEKVLEYFKSLADEVKGDYYSRMNDFQYKVGLAAATGVVKPKLWNIMAGAVGATMGRFAKDAERKRSDAAKATFEPNRGGEAEHLDESIGTRVEGLEVVIDGTFWTSGFYGETQIVRMHVRDTNVALVWFNSGAPVREPGNKPLTATLKGTVKKHQDHPKYGKSTVLNRCKLTNYQEH